MLNKYVKRYLCIILIISLTITNFPKGIFEESKSDIVYADEIKHLSVKFDDFETASHIQLNGDSLIAEYNGHKVLRLNEAAESQKSSVFTRNKIYLKNNNSFSTYFVFRSSESNNKWGQQGGDGFTFTLQTKGSDAIGTIGRRFACNSMAPNISIEFDTFKNNESDTLDTNDNHIGIDIDGSPKSISKTSFPYYITDGNEYHVWVDYNGAEQTMEIRVNKNSHIRPIDANLTNTSLDLSTILNSNEIYAGFTSTTGEPYQQNDILKWYFYNDYNPIDIDNNTYVESSMLSISANPENGASSSTITAIVTDATLSPVSGVPVEFTTDFGILSKTIETTDVNGKATVILNSITSGIATVKALASGGLYQETTVELLAMSDQECVNADVAALSKDNLLNGNVDSNNIVSDLSLSTTGTYGTTIKWISTDINVINTTGKVTRPTYTEGNKTVDLTATVSKGTAEEKSTEPFSFIVIAEEISDQESVDTDVAALNIDDLLNGNIDPEHIITDLSLPTTGTNGTKITWISTDTNTINNTGQVFRPINTEGDKTVTLTATVSKGTAEEKSAEPFSFTVIAEEISDQESVDIDVAALNIDDLLNGNVDPDHIITDLSLPTTGANETEITWISSDANTISNTGQVFRPTNTEGDKTVTLTATVSKGTAEPKSSVYSFIVKADEMSSYEKLLSDFKWLKGQVVLNGNESSDEIIKDLNFAKTGPLGSTITWTTSNNNLITTEGKVTRPAFTEGNQLVTVTSKNTLDGQSKTKRYVFNVLKLPTPNNLEAVTLDAEQLDYSSFLDNNISPFSITDDLELPLNGQNGSSITWSSSNTAYATNSGIINRPAYEEGYVLSLLTATIEKGDEQIKKYFDIAINPLPDTTAPQILSATPTNVDTIWDANTITIDFSECITIGDINKITVKVTDDKQLVKYADIEKEINDTTLTIIPLYENTDSDKIELLIEKDAIEDLSGNTLTEDFELDFTLKKSRPVLTSSNITNNQRAVDITQSFEFEFDNEIFVDESFITLKNWWNYEFLDIIINKDNNKLIIIPTEDLEPNQRYELIIDKEAVKNNVQNPIKESLKIVFTTESILEVNIVSPQNTTDTYIFGDYIRLKFDQLIEAKVKMNDWQKKVDYFLFDKYLYINKKNLDIHYIEDIPYYKLDNLDVHSQYNNRQVSFESNEAIEKFSGRIEYTNHYGWTSYRYETFYKFIATEVNIGSSPETPSEFGEPINTPNSLTLDYGDNIQAINLDLIRVENAYGRSIEIISEINGSKLIIKPESGEWASNKSYILKVPEGALNNSQGESIKLFEYPFKTPEKYDYTGTTVGFDSPTIAVGGTNYIWLFIRCNKYHTDRTVNGTLTNISTGEIIEDAIGDSYSTIKCNIPGTYEVFYEIIDNGYKYEFKDTFEVVNVDSSLSKISADRKGTVKAINYTDFEDEFSTKVTLSNGNIPLGDREVKFELIGNSSGKVYYSSTKKSNSRGNATFTFNLDDKPYGKFRVVISAEGISKKYIYYIKTEKVIGSSDLNILLYDVKTKKLIRSSETLDVYIDNEYHQATRLNNYTYQLNDIRPGKHTIEVFNIEYYNDKTFEFELQSGKNKVPPYLSRYIPSSEIRMNKVTSDYSGNSSSSKDTIFIDGVDANITFKTSACWYGHEPGNIIYEFYNGSKKKQFTSKNGELTVNMGNLFGAGTRGRVYAVSKDGTKSSKYDMHIEVAGKPLMCYASYSKSKKQYYLNYNFNLESIAGAKAPNDWPLFGGENFSADIGKFKVGGIMDKYGKIQFAVGLSKLDFENANVVSNYKDLAKNFKNGFYGNRENELSFSFDTNQVWQYDKNKNSWSYEHGDYILYLEGEASYTQYFMVVVVPAYLRGALGVDASGKLNVDSVINNENKSRYLKYSGVINIAPSLEIAAGAGVPGLNVEGFFKGTLETSWTIPNCDFGGKAELLGGLRASALVWNWEKTAIKYEWIIDEQQVAFNNNPILLVYNSELLPTSENGIKQSDFSMINRTNSDSELWRGNIPVILENVPEFTKTALAAIDNNNLLLVWPEDNPNRTSANRTELKYAIYDGSNWIEGDFFNNDDTADFNPVIEAATEDSVTIAWEDLNKLMNENEEMDSFIAATEISVAEYNHSNDTLSETTTLTNDQYYDSMPAIASSNGKTYIVWVKNKSNNIFSPQAGSFEILYAEKEGTTWSEPIGLEKNLNHVINLDIAAKGDSITVVYNVDEDGNIFTNKDWEIYSKQYNNGVWTSSTKLTNDQNQDNNVRVFYENGQVTALYLKDGILTQMNITTKEISSVGDIAAQSFEISCNNDTRAISYASNIQNGEQSIISIFYDSDVDQWSNPIEITKNNRVNSGIKAAITKENEMTVIYKATEKITEQIEGEQFSNVGASNIETYKKVLKKDLKVLENSIAFTNTFILDNDNEINAVIENCGEFTVNGFDVEFYDGDMNKIGVATVNESLLPGEKINVSTIWETPETLSNNNITVIVDPNNQIGDIDQTNNTLTEAVITCDVSIEGFEKYLVENNNYLLELTLGNYSSVDADNIKIDFYHNNVLINTQTVEKITGGSTGNILLELNTSSLFGDSTIIEGKIDIDVLGTFKDTNDENNVAAILFEKEMLQVISSNIVDGQLNVPVNKEIELEFNKNILEGSDYNNIELADFDGNLIPITKEITESILVVNPIEKLKKGNYYTLTLPKDSFTTESNEIMEDQYNLTFTTDLSDISIVGTYPIEGSTEMEMDEDIVIKFNTNIFEGYTFENIVLIKNDIEIISSDISISDNILTINPARSIDYNASYEVKIPVNSIIDNNGESLETEKQFSFIISKDVTEKPIKVIKIAKQLNVTEKILKTIISKNIKIFNIPKKLINSFVNSNEELIINREDITLKIRSQNINNSSELELTIENQPNMDELTHYQDNVLSSIYTIKAKNNSSSNAISGRVDVIIPIDISQITNIEKCSVFYKNEKGEWIAAGGIVDTDSKTIKVSLSTDKQFMVVERDITYKDIKDRWSSEAIEVLASKGIINGRNENKFDPKGNITRAEFTTLIVRSLYEDKTNYNNQFTDIPSSEYYADSIAKAIEYKLISGVGNGKFAPNEFITREQMITILDRLYEFKIINTNEDFKADYELETDFTDLELASNYAKNPIKRMAYLSIVNGYNGKINPRDLSTREEAAIIIYKFIKAIGEL